MTMPIVTNADRDWALAQKPAWARLYSNETEDLGEIVDDGGWMDTERRDKCGQGPSWFDFVVGEIESFEKYFSGQNKSYAEWSTLWRNGWWPKRREDWAYKMAPRKKEPFFRKGTPEFARAITVASAQEKPMWLRFGVAQFKPDDARLEFVQTGVTEQSKRMNGDAA